MTKRLNGKGGLTIAVLLVVSTRAAREGASKPAKQWYFMEPVEYPVIHDRSKMCQANHVQALSNPKGDVDGDTPVTLTATLLDAGGNPLIGRDGADALNGLGGTDALAGLDGDDSLDGGAGSDLIAGGRGADLIWSGASFTPAVTQRLSDLGCSTACRTPSKATERWFRKENFRWQCNK